MFHLIIAELSHVLHKHIVKTTLFGNSFISYLKCTNVGKRGQLLQEAVCVV